MIINKRFRPEDVQGTGMDGGGSKRGKKTAFFPEV